MSYPEKKAEEIWRDEGGVQYSIVRHERLGHYCGYCRFVERPVREVGYKGILTYVPVHGGITYANNDDDGMVYGFHCAHVEDESNFLLTESMWLRAECEQMTRGILLAAEFEEGYLLAETTEEKAEIIQIYHDRCQEEGMEFKILDNFGAMINALCGVL